MIHDPNIFMEITVFYLSGTGNTWWVARTIGKYLKVNDNRINLVPIEWINRRGRNKLIEMIGKSDIIGLGSPVHNSSLPKMFTEFTVWLPDTTFKPVFAFTTQMFYGGNLSCGIEDILDEKGYLLKWSIPFVMPCNFHIPPVKLFHIPDYYRKKLLLTEAENKSKMLADYILHNIPYIEGTDRIKKFLTDLAAGILSLEMPHYRTLLKIDESKCNLCGYCAKICPAGAIKIFNGKSIRIMDGCFLCLRCYNFCPKKAVYLDLKIFDTRNAPRYRGPVPGFKPDILTRPEKI